MKECGFEGTALIWAALKGHADIVRILRESGSDLEAREKENGMTAWYSATVKGHIDSLVSILEKGTRINSKDKDTPAPLLWAIYSEQNDAMKTLLDWGAEIEAREGTQGMTALIAVAASNQTVPMKMLLERGVDIKARTFEGKTALMVAAVVGHYEAAKLLLENGSDVDVKDNHGDNALAYSMLSQGGAYTKQRIQEMLRRPGSKAVDNG